MGHIWPASFCDASIARAARATCAPGTGIRPRQVVNALGHCQPYQLVPGRMKLYLVASLAIAVVGAQHRRVFIRQHTPLHYGRAAYLPAILFELPAGPGRTFARNRLTQHAIGREETVVYERRRLVETFLATIHPAPPARLSTVPPD